MIILTDMRTCDCLNGWHAHSTDILNVQFSVDETSLFSLGADGKVTLQHHKISFSSMFVVINSLVTVRQQSPIELQFAPGASNKSSIPLLPFGTQLTARSIYYCLAFTQVLKGILDIILSVRSVKNYSEMQMDSVLMY